MTIPLLNLHPNHSYVAVDRYPLAQLRMVVPFDIWQRLLAYIPAFESENMAGFKKYWRNDLGG